MMEKICNLLEQRDFIVPRLLICNYKKINIAEEELVLLIYLLNTNSIFDPVSIAKDLNIEVDKVIELVSSLSDKNVIKIYVEKQGKINMEKVSAKPLYKRLALLLDDSNKKINSDLYSNFEVSFGRPLSAIEYETIGKWDDAYDEQLILLALRDTINKGIASVKYIDKILVEWEKKGFRTPEDVEKENIERSSKVEIDGLDIDWLNGSNN